MEDDVYKLEPDQHEEIDNIDMEFVLGKSAEFIHMQGDHSMQRILDANQKDWSKWPTRLHLDIILKQLLNCVGTLQAQVIELDRKCEAMKRDE
jgi:hypothetical protein